MIFFVAGMMAFVASQDFEDVIVASLEATDDMTPEEKAQELADFSDSIAAARELSEKELPSVIDTWNNVDLGGGFLGIIVSVFLGLCLVRDFRSGFAKNLPMDRRARFAYFGEKLVYALIVQVFFLALGAVVTWAAFLLCGFSYAVVNSIAEMALWLAMALLLSFAYALLTAVVAWLSRSEWVTVCWALLVSSGFVGALVIQAAQAVTRLWPWLEALPYWTLRGNVVALGESGPWLLAPNAAYPIPATTPAGQIVLVSLVVIAAAVVLGMTVCRKRDIK